MIRLTREEAIRQAQAVNPTVMPWPVIDRSGRLLIPESMQARPLGTVLAPSDLPLVERNAS